MPSCSWQSQSSQFSHHQPGWVFHNLSAGRSPYPSSLSLEWMDGGYSTSPSPSPVGVALAHVHVADLNNRDLIRSSALKRRTRRTRRRRSQQRPPDRVIWGLINNFNKSLMWQKYKFPNHARIVNHSRIVTRSRDGTEREQQRRHWAGV